MLKKRNIMTVQITNNIKTCNKLIKQFIQLRIVNKIFSLIM